jgi:hypothetical protein
MLLPLGVDFPMGIATHEDLPNVPFGESGFASILAEEIREVPDGDGRDVLRLSSEV